MGTGTVGPLFVSHSHKDKDDVNDLCVALRSAFRDQIRVFNTSTGVPIPPGTKWRDRIVEAVRDSELVILWGTHEALDSKEVAFEIGAAFAFGKRIIPCAVHIPPSDLPWSLDELHAITMDSSNGWFDLANVIANVIQYPTKYDEQPLKELAAKFAAPSTALELTTVGYSVQLTNSSDGPITIKSFKALTGSLPTWVTPLQGRILSAHEKVATLRDKWPAQNLRIDWTDVAGATHRSDFDVKAAK